MVKIAVFGGANENMPEYSRNIAERLGDGLGRHYETDLTILTGACKGLPNQVAQEARSHGSVVRGYSGAKSEIDHNSTDDRFEQYVNSSSLDELVLLHDQQLGRGLSQRSLRMIEDAEALIFIGGRNGTMGEYAMAYEDTDKPIFLVEGSGGFVDDMKNFTYEPSKRDNVYRMPIEECISAITSTFPLLEDSSSSNSKKSSWKRDLSIVGLTLGFVASAAFAGKALTSEQEPIWQSELILDNPLIKGKDAKLFTFADKTEPDQLYIGDHIPPNRSDYSDNRWGENIIIAKDYNLNKTFEPEEIEYKGFVPKNPDFVNEVYYLLRNKLK